MTPSQAGGASLVFAVELAQLRAEILGLSVSPVPLGHPDLPLEHPYGVRWAVVLPVVGSQRPARRRAVTPRRRLAEGHRVELVAAVLTRANFHVQTFLTVVVDVVYATC